MSDAKTFADKVAQADAADAVAKRALANPLPGPLADVFAIPQEIEVGPYKVRPFFDADFEWLKALGNPFYDMMDAGMNGKEVPANYVPRGQGAWEMCWLLTHTIKECRDGFKAGVQSVKEASANQFGEVQIRGLMALNDAIMKQVQLYWAPSIQYGPTAKEGEATESNPPLSGPPLTVSGGS